MLQSYLNRPYFGLYTVGTPALKFEAPSLQTAKGGKVTKLENEMPLRL